MLAGLYIGYVIILAKLNPTLAPPPPEETRVDLPRVGAAARRRAQRSRCPRLRGACRDRRGPGVARGRSRRSSVLALAPGAPRVRCRSRVIYRGADARGGDRHGRDAGDAARRRRRRGTVRRARRAAGRRLAGAAAPKALQEPPAAGAPKPGAAARAGRPPSRPGRSRPRRRPGATPPAPRAPRCRDEPARAALVLDHGRRRPSLGLAAQLRDLHVRAAPDLQDAARLVLPALGAHPRGARDDHLRLGDAHRGGRDGRAGGLLLAAAYRKLTLRRS